MYPTHFTKHILFILLEHLRSDCFSNDVKGWYLLLRSSAILPIGKFATKQIVLYDDVGINDIGFGLYTFILHILELNIFINQVFARSLILTLMVAMHA